MTAIARPLYRRADLLRLLHPSSIAVIGASTRPGSFGERVLLNLADYDGRIYPVNARYDRIGEHPCHPSIEAVPERADCAVIAASRDVVAGLVTECAAAGAGGVIVFASGYAELGRPERIAEQDQLANLAHRARMPLIGPNCIGVVNCIRQARMTFMPIVPPPELWESAIGLISQSGAFGSALAQRAARGVSFSHVLTSGNSCDVDMADYVAYLADEPACRAIACVFEGMAQPRRLLDAARIAWQADKPLIVFKMATGEHGAAAAMSHTGSLAGSHEAYRASLRREGAILVEHYEALLETAAFFAKAPPPKAQGVAILATSGGAGIMAADRAEQYGLPLPEPQPNTREILERHIPEFGSARNPCDVTAQVINDPASLSACATALLEQSDYGAIVSPQVYAYAPAVPRIALYDEMAARAEKPICSVWVTEDLVGPGARETELTSHVALFRSMDNCFAALAAWQRRAAMQRAPTERAVRRSPEAARAEATTLIRGASSRALTEREAKAVLAIYGVPVVGEHLAATADEA
ncbi:MAG: CoA-binding protein, partial [Acetobacteraceae bacterium]|nr:CoA-binding protein [Acetobacteraceae bacterium]